MVLNSPTPGVIIYNPPTPNPLPTPHPPHRGANTSYEKGASSTDNVFLSGVGKNKK